MILFRIGPSGVGKGTVRQELFKDQSLNLAYSISMTTRKPRPTEQEGVDYFFVSETEFLNKIENDELLEYAKFVGNYYGTPRFYVEQLLNEGKNVVLEIEVQGALQVMRKCPQALTIFLVHLHLKNWKDVFVVVVQKRKMLSKNVWIKREKKLRQKMNINM